MINDIFELTAEEIEMIAGSTELDPPLYVTSSDSDYPIVDNNPP